MTLALAGVVIAYAFSAIRGSGREQFATWRGPAKPPSFAVAARQGVAELLGMGDDSSPVAWDAGRGIWWSGNGRSHWWQSALAIRMLVRYLERTGSADPVYQYVLAQTYARNVVTPHAVATTNFVNRYLDDTAWWGLAWADASRYELLYRHDLADAGTFLRLAEWDAAAVGDAPRRCGGISWRIGSPPDTIANAEYAALAAELFGLRGTRPFRSAESASHWLSEARSTLSWLATRGLIEPSTGTVFDGLNGGCDRRLGWPMTYTEGEVAEAFTTLGTELHDRSYLEAAGRFLRYTISRGSGLTRRGVLQERCEARPDHCEGVNDPANLPAFKGVFMQALSEWASASRSSGFEPFVRAQARAILLNSLSDGSGHPGDCSTPSTCQFGFHWALPLMGRPSRIGLSVSTQASALDALIAALGTRS